MTNNHHPPRLSGLLRSLGATFLGTVQNRGELLAVEWQEERERLAQVLVVVAAVVFLGMMAVLLLTATIIFLFPEDKRVYVTAGFTVLYLLCTVVAWFRLRSLLRREPFAESLDQLQKDRLWLETLR